eukprot:s2688_g10.t1
MSVTAISDDRFAVIRKNTSQDTESFGFAMLTSTLIGISSCVAFYFLRQRYPMVYEGSTSSKSELRAQAFGFFGWLRTSVSYRFDDVIDDVGMDQIMLLEFTHLSMKVMFGIGIPALMVLAPLHARSGGANDDLSRIGLSNLDAETWILWVHAAFVWYVVLLVLCLVYRVQHRKFRPRRSRWLSNMPEARATTRLVEGIPEQLRTDAAMARFFDQIFGQPVVKDVVFVRDTSSLLPLIEARDMLSEELAQVGLQCAASHEAREAPSPRRLQTLERRYNRASAAAEEMATRVYSCQSFASDAAFVTFRDRRHAEFSRGLRYSESRGHFAVSLAPEPFDVHFASFTRSSASVEKGSALVGRLLVACVFFFFLPVVIGISSLLSVDSLTHLVPKLEVWSREYQYITTAWEALLGTSLLSMLMDLVPWVLSEVFSRFYRLRSGSKGQHKIQRWYFFFLVVFVLLVTAVGTSLFEAAARLAQEPLKVWYLLADQLPDSTNFYLRYAVLLWSTPFFDLVRCFPLLYFWKALQAGEPPEIAKELSEPEDQTFHGVGARSARWSLHMVLGLTLCSLQPFIPVILAIGFAFRRLVFGYLIVFVETKKSDSGGQLWRAQMQHTQMGLVIYILVMTLILLDREESMVAAIFAGSSGTLVALYWYWWPSLLDLTSLPVQQAELKATCLGHGDEAAGPEPEAEQSFSPYLQPELRVTLPVTALIRQDSTIWDESDNFEAAADAGSAQPPGADGTACGSTLPGTACRRSTRSFLEWVCPGLSGKGAVRLGVDKPLNTLARYMPTFGLQHIVKSAIPGAHNLMTALLLFFAVNLLVAAVPESVHFELPENLKVLDPDHNGILTGTEMGIVVRTLSIKLLRVLCYLETGLFALMAIAKPKSHQATSNDVIDQYWRSVDRKVMKPVIISILLHAVILLYTASGVLRTLGLAPRSILALGGVSGLAFGLAAQNLVGNFMSGLLLVLNRQFTVGDFIETNGIQGKVLAMGWTFIEIQRGEDLVMLPNSEVVGTTVVQIGRFSGAGGHASSESTKA